MPIVNRLSLLTSSLILALVPMHSCPAAEPDLAAMRQQAAALGELSAPPSYRPAEGYDNTEHLQAIYYDALPWHGQPTRVFAWLGLPQNGKGKVPGIVLVHGGGGTAFAEWVQLWNERGFAAISIAVEGQTDVPDPKSRWQRHEWAGPARDGIFADSDQPLADQWMYHAVADTVLAHRLLGSLPQVNDQQIGLMGISWGGIITSTVIGIDHRLAFGIPTYGCGNLATVDNHYGAALGDNQVYRQVWDPLVWMDQVKFPTLWLSWTGDTHFPLDAQSSCYRKAAGPYMVALVPKMRHSHPAGWTPPDSYAFAESVITTGRPWCRQIDVQRDGDTAQATFALTKPVDRAVLTYTTETGFTGSRTWHDVPAIIQGSEGHITAAAKLPPGATAWFINLDCGGLTVSSDFQTVER